MARYRRRAATVAIFAIPIWSLAVHTIRLSICHIRSCHRTQRFAFHLQQIRMQRILEEFHLLWLERTIDLMLQKLMMLKFVGSFVAN